MACSSALPVSEDLIEKFSASFDHQTSSPLFNGRIPPEIRHKIFHFACLAYDNKSKPYEENSHYSRPGFRYQRSISTVLLQTCRFAYLEAYHLPLSINEHTFWHNADRGPPMGWPNTIADDVHYCNRVPDQHYKFMKTVHLFTQQFWLERGPRLLRNAKIEEVVEKVILTIRRGDWWWWENDQEMGIDPRLGNVDARRMRELWRIPNSELEYTRSFWGSRFRMMQNLKVLEIEMECANYKRPELEEIVLHAKNWVFPIIDGTTYTEPISKILKYDSVKWGAWTGPKCLLASTDARYLPMAEGATERTERTELDLVTATITFRVAHGTVGVEAGFCERAPSYSEYDNLRRERRHWFVR